MDLFRVRVGFEAQQTLGRNLQMFFRLRNKKIQYFPGNIVIFRQIIRETAFGPSMRVPRLSSGAREQLISKRRMETRTRFQMQMRSGA